MLVYKFRFKIMGFWIRVWDFGGRGSDFEIGASGLGAQDETSASAKGYGLVWSAIVRARHLERARLPHHRSRPVQGYLVDKKMPPPRTLPQAYAWGHRGVLGGWSFSYGRGTPVRHACSAANQTPLHSSPEKEARAPGFRTCLGRTRPPPKPQERATAEPFLRTSLLTPAALDVGGLRL